MNLPWDPDRELTPAIAAALIEATFPSMASRGLRFLGAGWEFDAYLTIDGWVVRFPRRADSVRLFARERGVLELVARFLPNGVDVPRPEYFGEPALGFPYPFAAHRFIPGAPADETDSRFLPALARQLALALGAIHSVPEAAARDAGIAGEDPDHEGGREWIRQRLAALSRLRGVDPVVERAARWIERTPIPLGGYAGPLRLIHQDLSPEHVLVDAQTGRLTGIIDWTDAMLGDAARDFVFLVAWRGWGFAEDVLRHYPHPIDPGFRDRLWFMARILTPLWLGLAYERGTEVEKLTGWVHNAFAPELHGIQPRHRT